MENKGSTKRNWSIVFWAILIGIFLIPQSRIFLQQQLMKIGFFKPKLEVVKESESVNESVSEPVVSTISATFKDEKGAIIDVAQLKGKVLFINFWATWCHPCKAEMPSIQKLYDLFKDNDQIAFLLVEIDENVQGANDFLKKEKLNLPIVYRHGPIPEEWLSGAIPTTVILDKQGKMVGREEGMRDYSSKTVVDFIQNLINQE